MVTITRKKDSGQQAREASRIALVSGPVSGHVTTGVRTAEGELRLIEWLVSEYEVQRIEPDGRLARNTNEVAITTRAGAFLTTALRVDGDLKVVTWDSGLEKLADSGTDAGEATQVTICPLDVIAEPPERFGGLVTAVRDSDGDLKVIEWKVSEDGRLIERITDSRQGAEEAKEISIVGGAREGGVNIVTTAVKTKENRLKLIAWAAPGTKEALVTRRAEESDPDDKIDDVVAVGRERVVTAVRTDGGNLQLIVWQVAPDGSDIQRLGDSGDQAGRASNIALAQFGPSHYLTAVRSREGKLRIIAWEVSANGRTVDRVGQSREEDEGDVSEVTIAQVSNGLFATAVRDSDGDLKVIAWKVEEE